VITITFSIMEVFSLWNEFLWRRSEGAAQA
jgi:hypothetical protein